MQSSSVLVGAALDLSLGEPSLSIGLRHMMVGEVHFIGAPLESCRCRKILFLHVLRIRHRELLSVRVCRFLVLLHLRILRTECLGSLSESSPSISYLVRRKWLCRCCIFCRCILSILAVCRKLPGRIRCRKSVWSWRPPLLVPCAHVVALEDFPIADHLNSSPSTIFGS